MTTPTTYGGQLPPHQGRATGPNNTRRRRRETVKTTTYVITRYGSNAANQPMCNRAVVGLVDATSRAAACKQAAWELGITVYNNQYLEAIPWSRAARWEIDLASQCDEEARRAREYAAALKAAMGY